VTTVALIGADGSGKTSVARALPGVLSRPVRYLYMGVSAESSNVILPTTRLARRLKRMVGAPPDTAGPPSHEAIAARRRPSSLPRRLLRSARAALRLGNRTAEEWYRQLVAWWWQRQGAIVIYDRHFFVDYHAYDVSGTHARSIEQRVHGLLLGLLPKPDLVIYLDAPGEVLRARKGEGTVEALEQRRAEYRALASVVPRFVEVDATQPVDAVVRDVADSVIALVDRRPERDR
jgi:thymidylate kinase